MCFELTHGEKKMKSKKGNSTSSFHTAVYKEARPFNFQKTPSINLTGNPIIKLSHFASIILLILGVSIDLAIYS